MRLVRALLWLLLFLVVALPLAAWLVPQRLDLDRYRGDIASAAGERLGRNVTIGGKIALRLLPEPTLTASDIAIGSGESVSITAAELRLRLALGPLLEGRIDARELVLRGADMRLPWPFDPSQVMVRTPYWLSSLSASIEDGRLSVGGLRFTGIDATLTTAGFGGSYAAAGTAQFSGRPWRFTARMTQPGGDGSAGLDVALDGQGPVVGIGATLSGQIGSDGTLTGRVSGRGPDLSRLLPAPAVSFKAEGRVTIAGGLAAADDLGMQIGGSPARGAVALRVSPNPRLDLALAASRLDLDAWLPVLAHTGPLPLPVGIDLSAEAASFAGGTLRGLRAAVDLTDSGAEVREVRAVLPGDAPLRLSGHIAPAGSDPTHPRFEGDVALAAPALRTTLAWLEQAGISPLGSLPDGVLRSANLTGRVTAEPGQFAVASLAGMVDGAHVAGSFSLRGGKRFAVGAGITLDRLELDPWLPAQMPSLAALSGRLLPFDLDLRLEVPQALLHGTALSALSLDAGSDAGRLTVRKLDVLVNSVHANAAATLGEGGRLSAARLDLQAPRAELLASLLPERLGLLAPRGAKFWQSPATVQLSGDGAPNSLALKLVADLADLRIEAQPILNITKGSWTATAQLRHPGAPRLAELLGWPGALDWIGEGSLSVVARLSGTAEKLEADGFELAAGDLRLSGALTFDHLDGRPNVTGRLDAETLPLSAFDPRSPVPLPFASLDGWDCTVKVAAGHVTVGAIPLAERASATVSLSQGVLRIDDLIAAVSGGALSGQAVLDSKAAQPTLKLAFGLADVTLHGPLLDWPVDVVSGLLDGGATVTASGHAPATLLATLAGQASLTIHNGTLAGVALPGLIGAPTEAEARGALSGGETPLRSLKLAVQVGHGVAVLTSGELLALSATGEISGTLDLPGAAVDVHAAIRPAMPDPPTLGLRLTGALAAPQKIPELAGLTLWRAAHAAP